MQWSYDYRDVNQPKEIAITDNTNLNIKQPKFLPWKFQKSAMIQEKNVVWVFSFVSERFGNPYGRQGDLVFIQ